MARKFKLRPISSEDDVTHERSGAIDRRQFMRLSFNTAAGLITTASLGSVGFASFLMGQSEGGSSDSAIKFYNSLGFKVINRKVEQGEYIEKLVKIKGVKLEWVKLKVIDNSILELLKYHGDEKSFNKS